MNVALFVTCLTDTFLPRTGEAVVRVLRHFGCHLDFPPQQTCCGQPAYNSGFHHEAAILARRMIEIFEPYETVVSPSASCTAMVKHHFSTLLADQPQWHERAAHLAARTHEFVTFLRDQLDVNIATHLRFDEPITFHYPCHARGIYGAADLQAWLREIPHVDLRVPPHTDVCCGFGGMFAVEYAGISGAMVQDKLDDLMATGAKLVICNEGGCSLQIAGAAHRRGLPLRFKHVAECLAESLGLMERATMSASNAFAHRVSLALANRRVVDAVHRAAWGKVEARAAGLNVLRNAEELRDLAAQIKQHTLAHLPKYLEQFATQVQRVGGQVHFAPDAAAARQIICGLARDYSSKLAVKVKSMTTEEIELNRALAAAGVQVFETDLGEFIVQIDHDRPSHIVTPIIHKDRRQVAAAMAREIGCEYTEDPARLTRIARQYLRDIFRRCDLGISGANFGVAETGTICIVTNEGNGRMTTTRPRVHIALMGIEKVIPRMRDLSVYLKLLARSSTGQPMGSYTSLITGPKRPGDPDGPEKLHVILLDNGRSEILRGPFAEVLRCIRCGACLNACPVYRNIGGHAYNSVYPGPIGSLITPLLDAQGDHDNLPRALSLCGACYVACPVKIDIPAFLIKLRAAGRTRQPWSKRAALRAWAWAMSSSRMYCWGQRLMASFLPDNGQGWATRGIGPLGNWAASRDLTRPPTTSFRERWNEGLRDEQ